MASTKSHQLKLIAEELKQKRRWYYMSFADYNGHRGSVIVRAHGEITAEMRARELGIHPGAGKGIGDVVAMALSWRDMQKIPQDLRNRLLSEREVQKRLEGVRL